MEDTKNGNVSASIYEVCDPVVSVKQYSNVSSRR
jgi:hypothetical protein